MQLARPHPNCVIERGEEYVRANVGHGTPAELEECYRTLATIVLEHKFKRVLVVGTSDQHAHSHLAARDAVLAMDVIGVPAGFKIAFVGKSDATLNGYSHAEIAARDRGLRAKVFRDEPEAIQWLTAPDIH